jgi:hypothetical protein
VLSAAWAQGASSIIEAVMTPTTRSFMTAFPRAFRHCERSEAIQTVSADIVWPRRFAPRNDEGKL